MTTETRHSVVFLFPGAFFPEESRAARIARPDVELALKVAPANDGWFGARITSAEYESFRSDSGEVRWLPSAKKPTSFRLLIGHELDAKMVEALPGDHGILLSNMRGNGWATVVKTRCGNFQPVEAGDVVMAPESVS